MAALRPYPFGYDFYVQETQVQAQPRTSQYGDHKTAAYGIFPMGARLNDVVAALNSAGFRSADICVFLSPSHPIADDLRNIKTSVFDGSREADLENTVSWLSHFGGAVIPGVGLFVGSPDYLTALTQSERLGARSNHGRMLAGLGIPEDAAARYESRVSRDASLVFISCDGSAQSEWAREVLRRLRAEEVCLLQQGKEKAKVASIAS